MRRFLFLLLFGLSSCNRPVEQAIDSGTSYLLSTESNGAFQLPEGYGNTFIQATVLRALGTAKKCGSKVPSSVLKRGARYLASMRQENSFWNFETPLPADLDDTAAALMALQEVGYGDWTSIGDLIARRQKRDGSFETWLLAEAAPSTLLHSNPKTVDIEVVAATLRALLRIDRRRYEEVLARGAEYLTRQYPAHWEPAWYFSPLYAGYQAGSFLLEWDSERYRDLLLEYRQRLLASQNRNGSWGEKDTGNPLETAFVIIFLSHYPPSLYSQQAAESMARGIRFLLQEQRPDGSWEKAPFFSLYPKSSVHFRKFIHGNTLYTTSYALIALCRGKN